MTDENPLHSGSRWEPAARPTPTPRPPAAADTPATATAPTPTPTPTATPVRSGPRRGFLAAAIVGLLAAGGLGGGLSLGHVAADEGSGQPGQVSQLRTSDHGPGDSDDDQGSESGTTQPGSPT